jgi:hypothetical protein
VKGGRIGRPVPEMPRRGLDPEPSAPAQAAEPSVATPAPVPEAEAPAGPYGDVLDMPAYLLSHKPMLPTTLHCELFGRRFVFTTDRMAWERAKLDGLAAFTGMELEACAVAAEEDRAWPTTLHGWIERKLREPRWYLNRAEACGEYDPRKRCEKFPRWTLGQVFARLGVRLLGVEMEG